MFWKAIAAPAMILVPPIEYIINIMLTSLVYFFLLLATGVEGGGADMDFHSSTSPDFCLQCERCSSRNASCTGAPSICQKSSKNCLTVTTEYVVGNERWVATYKGCTKKIYCFAPSMSFTFPSQRKRRAAKCCNKDLCNRGAVKLPPMQTKPNGLLCPGCFSTHAKCKPTETIKCHGEENKCVYYDITVEQGDQIYMFAKRGCGTKLACMNKPHIGGIPGLFVEVWKSAQCISALSSKNLRDLNKQLVPQMALE
ncbi:phospholipase A2 inhibitor and Ly6/PLAUR domain-containing protein-like [Sceloporus undulatus]|uniref:phospholipase A2 inhibitor and Ly6/PLAUR domain-containing protein-like n=1 Tax=Sceloporus undulatus TaxID=8520 RepID=UPI001C4D0139|nr:phospholipase A2 inhibitor and Ly6/PLAUR domain-containing protein-like [Sceloporus undulatus]